MDVSKLNGLSVIPEGLLELIAGGVVDDEHRNAARQFAQGFKDNGLPLENALSWWRTWSVDYVDPADQPDAMAMSGSRSVLTPTSSSLQSRSFSSRKNSWPFANRCWPEQRFGR